MQFELGTKRKGNGLTSGIKEAIHRLLNRRETRAVKVKMEGQREFINLIADCITDRIQVNMIGLYPNPDNVFQELALAKDRQQQKLEAYFGTNNKILA